MSRDEKSEPRDEVLYLAAGVVDVALDGVRGVLRRLPLVGEARRELRARGELAWARNIPATEAHLELLARQVERRAARDARPAGG
ncbi:hypothetical protein [Actinomadura rubrisoli]|uniref:Polyprenyl synthetase n=1 Tax=Actinomadura rubrisoli TaxID=2530368 RepID=A0A4R4ZQQ9_9ACTN|nr:hypothetical protein [Actinomadura rubrisoli]TDD60516.1 hypothetical protein E1298_45985 [Actinomadura rubrisoli]